MCGVVVACVDFRWTSVTNVDGADTPQMRLIRPRFNSWLIFNFFCLSSVCLRAFSAVLGLCGDGQQQPYCLLSRERSRLVSNYEYPSQSSQPRCRIATSRVDHAGISELCTQRTKRSWFPNEADFGRVRLSPAWPDCVTEQRTTWKRSEGCSSLFFYSTYNTIRQRGLDLFTGAQRMAVTSE